MGEQLMPLLIVATPLCHHGPWRWRWLQWPQPGHWPGAGRQQKPDITQCWLRFALMVPAVGLPLRWLGGSLVEVLFELCTGDIFAGACATLPPFLAVCCRGSLAGNGTHGGACAGNSLGPLYAFADTESTVPKAKLLWHCTFCFKKVREHVDS